MRPLHLVLTATLLIALVTNAAAQCNRTQCNSSATCNTGFGVEVCTNGTNNFCYYESHCSAYSQRAGDIILGLSGASPNRIVAGIQQAIQNALMNAYNNFCRANQNFLVCCPGAVSWPNQRNESAGVIALADVQLELPILSVTGSATWTSLVLRLLPNSNSSLCSRLTYATTPITTTPAATTTSSTRTTQAGGVNGSTVAGVTTTAPISSSSLTTSGARPGVNNTINSTVAPTAGTNGTNVTTTARMPSTTVTPPSTAPPTTNITASRTATSTGTAAPTSGAVTNTTMAAATTSRPEATNSSGSSRRRRRDLADYLEEPAVEFDQQLHALHREKRATATNNLALSLSTEAIQNITAGINITGVVETVLRDKNVTATATVSAATSPTTASPSSSPVTVRKGAGKPDRHNSLIAAVIGLLLAIFSFNNFANE